MSYHYTYVLMGAGFGILWVLFFLISRRTRKEMLVMSVIFGILGPIANVLFIKDWWSPLTLDGSRIGFLDSFIVGFTIGGVTGVLYEILGKQEARRSQRLCTQREHEWFLLMVPASLAIFFGGYYLFGYTSFLTSTLALFIPAAIILLRRRDLLIDAFATGILLVASATLVYNFVELLTPGWIQQFWHFRNVPAIVIYNMPIDDLLHYFFLGLFGGPLYEYWQGTRLKRHGERTR